MDINNLEKTELLTQTFRNIRRSDNLTKEAKQSRSRTLIRNPNILEKMEMSGDPLYLPFSMFELRRAIISAHQTTPCKDGVCYRMLEHLTEGLVHPLSVTVLRLFNRVWECGQLPSLWKQAIIVPVQKPGKDPSDPSSYRPIALTTV